MKVLGLDLGTNSIGWAVVEKQDNEYTLLHKGVRIFQEGVKIEKGVEGSKAAERTMFRSARRIKYRRKLRKIQTLKVLSEYGFCPELSHEELNDWRYKKIYPENTVFREWLRTDEELKKNPYYFRNQAVTRKYDLDSIEDRYKIGRAFYHISQRRGFKSNRLETTPEHDGVVISEIRDITESMGERTLGQYFYERLEAGEKVRNSYTHREEHYLNEVKRICAFQNLPAEFTERIIKAIFYQRPLRSQKGLIGKCVFEKNKNRCSVSRPEFEEYRMLCFLNNIRIKTPDDEKLRVLTENEREIILPLFYRKSKDHFDFEDIAKKLAPKKQYKYYRASNINREDWQFNYSMKTTVSACPVTARFMDVFGEGYRALAIEYQKEKDHQQSVIDIDDVWHVLYTFDDEQKLIDFAHNRLKLDDAQIKEFLRIKLRHEYSSLSLKAIKKILPYLRRGMIYSHAVFMANMDEVLPGEIWQDKENQEIISDGLYGIIKTQNTEKDLVQIVNAVIKKNQDTFSTWSEEAEGIYRNELVEKIESHYGPKRYAEYPEEISARIESRAFSLFRDRMSRNNGKGIFAPVSTIESRIEDFLVSNFGDKDIRVNKLYHPSKNEVFKPPEEADDGKFYLNSPMVSSIRNPMAMRAIHQLRKLINELIKENLINQNTRVNIEMSRGLLNANERKGLQDWQRDRENKRASYIERIIEHYGRDVIPTEDEILRYQLWEDQNHICVYTGMEIGLSDFLGPDPKFDIEHTIPRSVSFDDSQANKTLCERSYNRDVKRNRIPDELPNHNEILERISYWKDKCDELDKQINAAVRQAKGAFDKNSKDRAIQKRHKLTNERSYWYEKYKRFLMKDVPEGFKNSQLVDTGIITKYSRLYLKTLFDKVYTVKGNTVAEFRKMWGLQNSYEKKERLNHIHHCIDAITIACISKTNYEQLANYYHDFEEYALLDVKQKPDVQKPWPSFTEDVKSVESEVLVSHHTNDVLPKQSKKKLRARGKIIRNVTGEPIYQQGDTIRGSLHKETFYGAIEQTSINSDGRQERLIRYVVRKPIDILKDSDLKNVVDGRVKEVLINARLMEKEYKKEIDNVKKELQKAEETEEDALKKQIAELEEKIAKLYCLPNKNGNPVPIRKVRLFQNTITNPIHLKKQRDKAVKNPKAYKEDYHVANDGNYVMAIYEGKNDKGRIIRDFEIVNNLKAGEFFKFSTQQELKAQGLNSESYLVPAQKSSGKLELPLRAMLKIGTMVIFYENSPDEVWSLDNEQINRRLYRIIKQSKDGRITFKFHQEARNDEMIKSDYEQKFGVKPPKSLTNGYSQVNFTDPHPKLLLSPSNFNMVIEGCDFQLTLLGEIKKLNT